MLHNCVKFYRDRKEFRRGEKAVVSAQQGRMFFVRVYVEGFVP
jgi:hypothetical protein